MLPENMNPNPNGFDYPISSVDLRSVIFTDDFWFPRIRLIQKETIRYAIEKCKDEGRLENFLVAGKQKEGKARGQTPFDDTDVYKIIEGSASSLLNCPDRELDEYLDTLISIIQIGQEPDGYLTTWFTIDRKNPPADWVRPSEERWENEVSSHELYNSGHLFEAAAVHHRVTGKTNFLEIALKNADLLIARFGPGKIAIPPGHQIVETGLISLYRITKNLDYLNLAEFFLEARGNSETHELYGEYSQDHVPVLGQTEAVGHAVRAVYMYAAMTDIVAMKRDLGYRRVVMELWKSVVSKKMYLTGAIGSRHLGEAFGDDYELPNLTAYGETCASIGNIYWNHRLFLLTGESRYFDIIERTLYNGMLSGISLDGKRFFYPNPLESDGEYTFNHDVSCTRSPWFDCSCCPTNLIRFLPSLPGLVYALQGNTLFVNLFASNEAKIPISGTMIGLIQKTDYPWSGQVQITLQPESEVVFEVKIRVPGWAQNQVLPGDLYHYDGDLKGKIEVRVNNQSIPANMENGYIVLKRKWSSGDRISLGFPMEIRRVRAHEKILDNRNKVAFECGPIVYCAEQIDNPVLSDMKFAGSDLLSVQKTEILNSTVNTLFGFASGETVTLIPYYLWSNRGVGQMKVWFPQSG